MSKHKILYIGLSLILLLACIGLTVQRSVFLSKASKTTGEVSEVKARNSTCRSGTKRRRSRPCTRFTARIKYTVDGNAYTLVLNAGKRRGHNHPISMASYRTGARIPIVYDPTKPQNAFHDSFFSLWGTPLVLFALQIAFTVAAFIGGRGRQYSRYHYG